MKMLTQIKERLPGGAGQLNSLGNVARFFGALLVLTLVARGTGGAAMPKVETAAPRAAALTETITASGAVTVQAGRPFQLPEGLLVTEVCVEAGAQITAGAPLARVDAEQLAQAIRQAEAELRQMQVSYAQGMEPVRADDYSVQQSEQRLADAYADSQETWDKGEASVQKAQDALDAARAALADARNAPLPAEPVPPVRPATPETATPETPAGTPAPDPSPTPDPTPAPDAWTEYEKADAAYQQAYAAYQQAKSEHDSRVAAAQNEVEAARAALELAKESAAAANEAALDMAEGVERERDSAVHSYEQALESAQKAAAASQAAAGVTAAGIAAKQTELERLRALERDGGAVLAPYSGTVTALALTAGAASPAVGGLLADTNTDSVFTFTLPKAQAGQVRAGMAVHVSQGGRELDTTVHTLSPPDADGSVQAAVLLPAGGGWQTGGAVARLTAELGSYSSCLPAAALHSAGGSSFVYKVEAQDTVLGRQNVLVRIPVTVDAGGGELVAVSGAISGSDAVVVGADRPLSAGARVRFAAEDGS